MVSSFLTRCRTRAPCFGRAESWPLGHQGILLTARGPGFYPGNIYLHWTLTGFSSEEEISSDNEELIEEKQQPQRRGPAKRKLETEDYPSFMAKRFADFTVYRNRTLQKWHDKTKLASGKLGKASVGGRACVRVCVSERERKRERERGAGRGNLKQLWEIGATAPLYGWCLDVVVIRHFCRKIYWTPTTEVYTVQASIFNFISEECFKSRNGGLVSVGKTKYLKETGFTTINIKGAEVNLWV